MKISALLRDLLPEQKLDLQSLDISNRVAGDETSALDFIYGDTTMLFSGPPLLSQARKYPDLIAQVGASTSISINQRRNDVGWDEFGYKYTRSIPGKIQNSISIGKIHTSKSSGLSSMYKWLAKLMKGQKQDDAVFISAPGNDPEATASKEPLSGYSDQMFNLSSEMFCIPFGLFLVQLDGNLDIRLTRYAENCKLPALSEGYSSEPASAENLMISCTRIIPATGLKVSTKKITKPYSLPGPGIPAAKFGPGF